MNNLVLQCEDLFCERDDRILFEGLSFALETGEVMQVAGPNGAGKSTLLRILAGLSGQFEGRVSWPAAASGQRDYRQDLLYIGHRAGIREELTALENLAWWCRLHRQASVDLMAALAQVALAGFEDVPVSMLSAGQKRRVMLALLWCTEKPVWLLDEPFTALDSAGVMQLEARLRAHAEQGGLVVYSSHHRLSEQVRHLHLGPVSEATCS